jgi:hypothetical protein
MTTMDGSETYGLRVGDPTPDGWLNEQPPCPAMSPDNYFCTATEGHNGPHVATGGPVVMAVWS